MNHKLIASAALLCSSVSAYELSADMTYYEDNFDVEVDYELTAPPDFYKTFQELVAQNGFAFETHPVTTDDGYILNVFRIVNDKIKNKKGVVFLQHGVTDSADCWVVHYPEVAPAFQLVRAGYDVWLGN
jgi:pimeloyl-ACP methyl ester carboxylesterase